MGKRYHINPGDQFGRLIVIGRVEDAINKNDGKHMSQYLCRCTCPDKNVVIVKAKNLVSGDTKSCGCLLKETAAKLNSKTPVENTICAPCNINTNMIYAYKKMLYESKCRNSQESISIYGKWNSDKGIIDFYNKMNSTYIDGCKISRIDETMGFIPGNCYWEFEINNQDDDINNRFISFNGFSYTVIEWNIALGYDKDVIKNRLLKGYSDEEALFGKESDILPINAIWFINEYGRPLNKESINEL